MVFQPLLSLIANLTCMDLEEGMFSPLAPRGVYHTCPSTRGVGRLRFNKTVIQEKVSVTNLNYIALEHLQSDELTYVHSLI